MHPLANAISFTGAQKTLQANSERACSWGWGATATAAALLWALPWLHALLRCPHFLICRRRHRHRHCAQGGHGANSGGSGAEGNKPIDWRCKLHGLKAGVAGMVHIQVGQVLW